MGLVVAPTHFVLHTSGSLSAARRGTARALSAARPEAVLILQTCVASRTNLPPLPVWLSKLNSTYWIFRLYPASE